MSENSSPLENIFEERAEYLSRNQLEQWTSTTPRELLTLKKLTGAGPKLLTGPRGSGKSTLLRQAFFRLAEEGRDIGIYVNYSKSLALEPLFKESANALTIFRQWVLAKIVLGFRDSLKEIHEDLGIDLPAPESLITASHSCQTFVKSLESGKYTEPAHFMAPSELILLLEYWADDLDKNRCILLLDDAAHAFSSDQQREFFEIFREMRSKRVSPKAAVYPGITSYSPNFHVGHEAEKVEAWLRPEDEDYLSTMHDILERRLPDDLKSRLKGKRDLVDMLALASFGLPRGFIAMISQLLGVGEETTWTPTRQRAFEAVSDHVDSVHSLFSSLSSKLVRYRNFVTVGTELTSASGQYMQSFNSNKRLDEKAATLALQGPLGPEVTRMLELLEYAGIFRGGAQVSRGSRVYQRYTLHYAFLINNNYLGMGRTFSVADIVAALTKSSAATYPRVQTSTLLGRGFESRCTIDLAPCTHCGTPRASEDAKFCIKCGMELEAASIYKELLKASIDKLPLTEGKLKGILNNTPLRTVNDILIDEENAHLRSVRSIGPIWCARIRRYAEEYVSV